MTLSQLFKRHRLALNLSQEGLAERANLSAAAISAIERGKRRAPYRETVMLLGEALELSAQEVAEFAEAASRGRGSSPEKHGATPRAGRIPAYLTSFVGRTAELAQLRSIITSHRLITITGSAGVGKMRTVCELLSDYDDSRFDGIYLC